MYIRLIDRKATLCEGDAPITYNEYGVNPSPIPNNPKIHYFCGTKKVNINKYKNSIVSKYTDLMSTLVDGYPTDTDVYLLLDNEDDIEYLLSKFRKISFSWKVEKQ